MQFGKNSSIAHNLESNESLANPFKLSLDMGNITAGFGSSLIQPRGRALNINNQKFERTLSPLSEEKDFSDEEEIKKEP